VSTYGSSGGVIYCKVHLKQYGKPEASKDVGFISPLHKPVSYNENRHFVVLVVLVVRNNATILIDGFISYAV
jgi:hypothetical protein